jgi:hypothetical protein
MLIQINHDGSFMPAIIHDVTNATHAMKIRQIPEKSSPDFNAKKEPPLARHCKNNRPLRNIC